MIMESRLAASMSSDRDRRSSVVALANASGPGRPSTATRARGTRAVVPGMVVRGRGHVISLGSTAGELAYPNGAVYCGTKAAERLINDGLRQDVLGTPIRVTSVDPGMVQTDFSLVRFHGDRQAAKAVYAGLKALSAEDVAECILFAVTRPPHVDIDEMVIRPVAQATSFQVARKTT